MCESLIITHTQKVHFAQIVHSQDTTLAGEILISAISIHDMLHVPLGTVHMSTTYTAPVVAFVTLLQE
jgi:hypothetical protein